MPVIVSGVLVFDAVLATASFLIAFRLREGRAILGNAGYGWSEQFLPYAGILMFAVPVRLSMLLYQRVYRFHGAFSYPQEAARILKAVSVASLLIVAWAFLFRGGFSFREFSYSRTVFLADFLISLLAFTTFHLAIRYAQTLFRDRGINLIPTLIIGSNPEVRQTVRELSDRPHLGYRITGVIRSDSMALEDDSAADFVDEIPVLGGIADISRVISQFQIQEVIITDNSVAGERLFEAMMSLRRDQRVEFRFTPSLFNMLPQKTSVEQIGVLPMVRLFREPLGDTQRLIKRISDLILAGLASIVAVPVLIAAAIAVKWDSPGPILFKQERVGMDGRVFLCYKFRSMMAGADDSLHRDAYRRSMAGGEVHGEGEHYFGKVKDDPRITGVGSFLRRSSIDELPQLINVLRGEMSMVGPRPPIPYEVQDYDVWHRKRLDMKPGITGLWQVSGRNRLTFEEMVRVDLYYVENWSLLLDLKIVLMTIPTVLRGDGAR